MFFFTNHVVEDGSVKDWLKRVCEFVAYMYFVVNKTLIWRLKLAFKVLGGEGSHESPEGGAKLLALNL